MKTSTIQIVIITLLIPLGFLFQYAKTNDATFSELFFSEVPVLHIGEIPVRIEIADTDSERVRGLSGRNTLENIDGLLFIFPTDERHAIWMKDMKFPIDIIWISEDLKVIDITKNATPESYPAVYRPTTSARYALETDVHFSDAFGIAIGQTVQLPEQDLEK
jgi:uncharacterized membrane protein (UPF0127 family)